MLLEIKFLLVKYLIKITIISYSTDKYSLLGDLGYTYEGLGFEEFMKEWAIEQKTITAGFSDSLIQKS